MFQASLITSLVIAYQLSHHCESFTFPRPGIGIHALREQNQLSGIVPSSTGLYSKSPQNDDQTVRILDSSSVSSILDKIQSARKEFTKASAEGFGTRAKNVANTMCIGDIIVPICGNLEQRQALANRGIYAGVEYELCSITLPNGTDVSTMEYIMDPETRNCVSATIKPAYKLRDYLERTDWPVQVNPIEDVPLWLSKTTYEAGTMVGTLGLSLTYFSVAAVLAFFIRFVYVPSPSMQPVLNPGDVVIVTRSFPVWPFKPSIGDVVLFEPPSELSRVVADSAAAMENGAMLPNKGEKFLKRVVAKEGEYVGVKNSQPYVDLSRSTSSSESNLDSNGDDSKVAKNKYRVDIVGSYAQPTLFSESSWNRPPEKLNRNQWFVAGDNGFRSVDSRVWGPLNGKNIVGTAKWVLWPIQDFGPVKEGQIFDVEK